MSHDRMILGLATSARPGTCSSRCGSLQNEIFVKVWSLCAGYLPDLPFCSMLKTNLGFGFSKKHAAIYGQFPAVDCACRDIGPAGVAGESCALACLLPANRCTSLQ
jgi:hypothetical protein